MQTETIIPDNVEAIIEAYFTLKLEEIQQANPFDKFGSISLSAYGNRGDRPSIGSHVSIANSLIESSQGARICDAVADQIAKLNRKSPKQAKLDRMAEIAAEMERLEAELDAEVVS